MPQMPPLRPVVAILLMALLAIPVAGQAQASIPPDEGEVLPQGATWESLALARVDALPVAPVDVALYRFTLEPGAGFSIELDDPSFAMVFVETGELSIRFPSAIVHVPTPGGGSATEVVEWETHLVVAGDSVSGLPLAGEHRNDGSEPATLLILGVSPTSAEEESILAISATFVPERVIRQTLAVGHVEELPPGPWSLAIARLTAEPVTVFPAEETTEVQLAAIEAGSFVYSTVDGPPIQVMRGLASIDPPATRGAQQAVEEIGPDEEATVEAGEGLFIPPGNVTGVEVAGDEAAAALLAFVAPASAPGLTGRASLR